MNIFRKPILFIFMLGLMFALSCSANKQATYRKSKTLMDTFVTITVVSDSKEKAETSIDNAFTVMERFGNRINFFSEESELSLINKNAGVKEVKVSPETLDLIENAVYVSEKSGGAFDPTIGPLIKLWDFYKKIKPSYTEISGVLHLVNYKNIVIDRNGSTVFLKRKGMLLDLGGIAKGYAADMAVADLKRNGIQAGIVAIAGDIKTFGAKPDGNPWNIGIRNPRQKSESDEVIAKIKLSDMAISTSGDYERYFLQDGKRYHHLLVPRTGRPADCCRSVSIIADKGAFADAFSTAVFILGPEKGLELVQKLGMDAVIIDNNGRILTTQNIKRKIKIERFD
ncbi:MAG: FAD:protein FMN transferase [Nitrospirota bacterium]